VTKSERAKIYTVLCRGSQASRQFRQHFCWLREKSRENTYIYERTRRGQFIVSYVFTAGFFSWELRGKLIIMWEICFKSIREC